MSVKKPIQRFLNTFDLIFQILNEKGVRVETARLLLLQFSEHEFFPLGRQRNFFDNVICLFGEEFFADIFLCADTFLFGTPIISMTFLHFAGDTTTAFFTRKYSAKNMLVNSSLHRVSVPRRHFRAFIKKFL